jgi:hypothetical protein
MTDLLVFKDKVSAAWAAELEGPRHLAGLIKSFFIRRVKISSA